MLIPSNFEFLDPDRPDVVYEKDMTPEERERFKVERATTKARQAKSSIQSPYKICLPDGTKISREDMSNPRDTGDEPGTSG